MKHNVERLMEMKRKDCVGCHACFAVCPVHAISMSEDAEGFCIRSWMRRNVSTAEPAYVRARF